jgi:hypothetical protein
MLPIELINEILCYLVSYDNFCDLLLLNKEIYNYFINYCGKLVIKSISIDIDDVLLKHSVTKFDITRIFFGGVCDCVLLNSKYYENYIGIIDENYIRFSIRKTIYNKAKIKGNISNFDILLNEDFYNKCIKLYENFELLIYRMINIKKYNCL